MVDAEGPGARRGVVEVAGLEARALLQRLITNDVDALAPGEGRYAALLSPQGKILVDFFVVSAPAEADHFLLDCPAALAADLAKRLTLYRLRAKATIADRSADLAAVPVAGGQPPSDAGITVYRDPRDPKLGFRALGPRDAVHAGAAADEAYRRKRIAAAVPEGGRDFRYGDTFPHEANLDLLAGVDFTKGCYVGQEVVSRMQHRSTTRKRVIPFVTDGAAPESGTEILAGDLPVGVVGTVAADRGLAFVRLDRVADANAAGTPLRAGGTTIRMEPGPVAGASPGSA